MNKIRSGLPYKEGEIGKIYEVGAVVDMSKVQFKKEDSIYDNMKMAITYLRNTNFDIELDCRGMNFDQKSALLKAYLDTNVRYDIKELNTTWLQIFYYCANIDYNPEGAILNQLELECFIANEVDYIRKLADFIISLPLFLVLRLDVDNLDTTGIEEVEDSVNLTNFIHIIKHSDFGALMSMCGEEKPKNYVKIFNKEHEELFQALLPTMFGVVLTGMASESPETYYQFLKGITPVKIVEESEECQNTY